MNAASIFTRPFARFGRSRSAACAPQADRDAAGERRAHLREMIDRAPSAFCGDVDLYAVMSVYPRDF